MASNPRTTLSRESAVTGQDPISLNVGCYPYVPSLDQFKSTLQDAWKLLHPDIPLMWVDYTCYETLPSSDLDVFVFDSFLLPSFVEKKIVAELPASSPDDDFWFWAQEACTCGSGVYGKPILGCVPGYIYHVGDEKLDADLTLKAMYEAIGMCIDDGHCPPQSAGLMIDLSSPITCACLYIQTWLTYYGFTLDPPLPDVPDPVIIAQMAMLVSMAGKGQAEYIDQIGPKVEYNPLASSNRRKWFKEGHAQAYAAYSELLALVGHDDLPNLQFRALPVADPPTDVIPGQLAHVDIAGISSALSGAKLQAAIDLMTLMAAPDVLYKSLTADTPKGNPQYIVPSRTSTMVELAAEDAMYNWIYERVVSKIEHPLMMGSKSWEWLHGLVPGAIQKALGLTPSTIQKDVELIPPQKA